MWEAVQSSFEARNFSSAILDAIHLLSDVIRDRSGLESDGVQLIGAAFGGSSPKLKVNRLQTESELNVQKGIESLLRGVYQAVRNPRSHGAVTDDERDAVAILLFLDYLLRVVDQSRSPFSLPGFVAKVLDPDFVPDTRYATLLVNEIPEKRRLATCREIFGRRSEGETSKLRFFFKCILAVMSEEDKNEFSAMLSEELSRTDDDATIRFVLGAFPDDIWLTLTEIARLRIENKLVQSVIKGRFFPATGKCPAGSLGTWAGRFIPHFTLNVELWRAVIEKLHSTDPSEHDYVFHYLIDDLVNTFDAPPPRLVIAMKRGLAEGDSRFKTIVEGWRLVTTSEDLSSDSPWVIPFLESLAQFQPASALLEDAASPPPEDEVPF